jgi:hypothetical protein
MVTHDRLRTPSRPAPRNPQHALLLQTRLEAHRCAAKRAHWTDLVYHVKLRSPEQIFKLETERRISTQFAPLMTYSMGDVA